MRCGRRKTVVCVIRGAIAARWGSDPDCRWRSAEPGGTRESVVCVITAVLGECSNLHLKSLAAACVGGDRVLGPFSQVLALSISQCSIPKCMQDQHKKSEKDVR